MPNVKVYNMKAVEVGTMELNEQLFATEYNEPLIHQAVVTRLANERQGTKSSLTRTEVRGGGKKPYRQKGTGRARAGTTRSPIWVGGGTVFGPDGNQSYKISQNKKAHNLALRSALSLKVKDGMKVLDELKINEKKTKNFLKVMDALKVGGKALVVVDAIDENIYYSAANLDWVKLVTIDNVSVLDLLNVDTVVFTKSSVENLQKEVLK